MAIFVKSGEMGMTDVKEKIQGLYALKTYLASQAIEEHGPARESLIGMQKVVDSVVNLLKEQEAVEPKHNPLSPTGWFCGKCGMCISRFHDYCPSCGQEVKWDEI